MAHTHGLRGRRHALVELPAMQGLRGAHRDRHELARVAQANPARHRGMGAQQWLRVDGTNHAQGMGAAFEGLRHDTRLFGETTMSSGGGGNTTSTSVSTPWAGQQPYLSNMFQQAGN